MHSFEMEECSGDVLDIKVPANLYSGRSHHYGLAEEAAAIFNLKPKNIYRRLINAPEGRGLVKVEIKDGDLCRRYGARVMEVASVGQSDALTKKILKSCGINSINSVVDAMNLAMVITGQPLHAFDYDKLAGNKTKKIIVRKSVRGEVLAALDDKTYELPVGTLVIAGEDRPLAIAGIKGGADSGVGAKTKRILIEAANFEGSNIYRTSRALGLSTDASARFAHDLSMALVDLGLDLATMLISKAGGKVLDSFYAGRNSKKQIKVSLRLSAYAKLMGEPIEFVRAKNILEKLGFEVRAKISKGEGVLDVQVPAWRDDIGEEEDLIEELARIRGYAQVKSESPVIALSSHRISDDQAFSSRVRLALGGYLMDEVINSSFLSEKESGFAFGGRVMFGSDWRPVEVENPISSDKAILRGSLLPKISQNLWENAKNFETVSIFEIGSIFSLNKNGVDEKKSIALGFASKNNPKIILEAKGVVYDFLKSLNIYDFIFVDRGEELFVECGRAVLGRILSVPVARGWHGAVVELDGGKLIALSSEEAEYQPLSRFPGTWRDISLLLPHSVKIGSVIDVAQKSGPDELVDVDLMDEYSGPNLGSGKRSITLRLRFQSKERTLLDEEVGQMTARIIAVLKEKFSAEVR